MQTATVTLGSLVDRALFEVEAPSERGMPLVMGSNHLENTTDTQFTLTSGSLNPSDLAEFGSELVLVTERSEDVDPIYTVARGYYGTTKAVHAAGTVGAANPQFSRRRTADFIDRALTRLEALGVPLVEAEEMERETGKRHVVLPAEVRQVLQVLYLNETSGRVLELDGWFQYDTVPTATSPTGKLLMLPWYVADSDVLQVVYSTPYTWLGGFPDEAATVTLPVGAVDLPAAYAAAMLMSGREVSRGQLDRAEEWTQTEPLRGQGGTALVRLKWQEFYRTLDEARRVTSFEVPTHRPLVKRPKVRGV